jgi:DNA-directed RNA polymerase specialized sigma24 family protein
VAFDLKAGKLKWQKSANRERILDQSHLEELPGSNEPQLDDLEEANKGLTKAVQESLQELSPIERDVIEAFGCADDHELNAAQLGVELGRIHANGVPIPKGTIRQHKLRGKNKLIAKLKKRGYDIDNLGDKA